MINYKNIYRLIMVLCVAIGTTACQKQYDCKCDCGIDTWDMALYYPSHQKAVEACARENPGCSCVVTP